MKVREVVERIIKACDTKPLKRTCDQLIVGNWEAEVSGIVTTFMATVEVIEDAISMGANLIILGHNRTEEVGMSYLPAWLESLVPGMPVWFSEAGEPFSYL